MNSVLALTTEEVVLYLLIYDTLSLLLPIPLNTYCIQLGDAQGGFSALAYALKYGHKDVVEVLVSQGASLDHQTKVCNLNNVQTK